MRKRLSSRLTFIHKWAIPALCIGGCIAIAAGIFAGQGHGENGNPPPIELAWIAVIVAIGSFVIFSMMSFPLKSIWLDGDAIRVSNGWQAENIPLANVARVWSWRGRNPPQRVSVSFRRLTQFGDSIIFVPRFALFWTWGGHPAAAELRDAVVRAQSRERHTTAELP
jgi:hypothetical protein